MSLPVLNIQILQDENHAKEVKKLSDAIHDNYLRQKREEKKRKSDAAAAEKRFKMMKREEEEEEEDIKEEKEVLPRINGDSSPIKIENGRNGRSCKKRDSYKFQDDEDAEQAEEDEDLKHESEDSVTTVNGIMDVERSRSPLSLNEEKAD